MQAGAKGSLNHSARPQAAAHTGSNSRAGEQAGTAGADNESTAYCSPVFQCIIR